MRSRWGSEAGFTLVEVMTVVAILGILVTILIASYFVATDTSRKVACIQNQRALTSAVLEYRVDHGGALPSDITDLRPYVKWTRGFGRCVSTDASLTYDADDGLISCPTPGHAIQ